MRKSKEEIITELRDSFKSLNDTALQVPEEKFNMSLNEKWSTAENIRHLITATKATTTAYGLPKFVPVILYGKPNRTSHGYSKVVENYHKKLAEGGRATGAYVPPKEQYERRRLLNKLNEEGNKLIDKLDKKWTEEQLDRYHVPHPLLGLLTMRELAYFTIYHNGHHRENIRKHYLQ